MRTNRIIILVILVVLLGAVAAVLVLSQSGAFDSPAGGPAGGPGDSVGEVPAVTVTPSPTPVPVAYIVVAVQNLPRGLRFPSPDDFPTVLDYENLPLDLFPLVDRPENVLEGELAVLEFQELVSRLNEFGIGLHPWPVNSIPQNAITDPAELRGAILRTDVPRDTPIVATVLTENLAELADTGSDAAAVMPPGRVAVSIPMDRLTGLAYGIRDGDYVDIILSMLFVDIDPEFQSITPNAVTLVSLSDDGNLELQEAVEGRLDVGLGGSPVVVGPSEAQRPRLLTQRTVQAAWVLRVGDFPITGDYIGSTPTPLPSPTPEEQQQQQSAARPVAPPTAVPPPDIITLAVTPQDAVLLVWAIDARVPITLALRSAQDISQVETEAVTLEYVMTRYNISVPSGLPYALEPALRSIRQLIAFQEISLRDNG